MTDPSPYVLVSGDFVVTGGMDRANYALASYLARQGYPVHLVAHRAAPDLLAHPGVRLHAVPKLLRSYFLSGPLLDRAGRLCGRRLARRGARVVVNGGNCLFGDVNWVHYVHAGSPQERPGQARWPLRRRVVHWADVCGERRALRRARLVVTNSAAMRDRLLSRLPLDPARVQVVYYGIDPDRFRPVDAAERDAARARLGWPAGRPLVAFVGALGDRRKGFDTLFAAWQTLCGESDWDADLAVVGTGAELPAWQERADVAGLAGRVKFLGFRRDVPAVLAACDVLVHPARYEPYGLGVQEALCCGLPALVSARAGVAERYPPELADLLLSDPDDAAELAGRLRAWRRAAAPMRDRVAPFAAALRARTWDNMAGEIVRLIEAAG